MNKKQFHLNTAVDVLKLCEEKQWSLATFMIEREEILFEDSRQAILDEMMVRWNIMKEAAYKGIFEPCKSIGGLIGFEARQLYDRLKAGKSMMKDLCGYATCYAMSVMEVNASMGLIVAAPTAGSSGVIPGALLAYQEQFEVSDKQMVEGLFVASLVGLLVMANATVAGAEGGCQAEIGIASAMAASALCYLQGGNNLQCFDAASLAIANTLGLICDPIGGLVELPCQRRNAMGATNGIVCAEVALSGVSAKIPFDEAVETMYEVGRSLPLAFRETAMGGLAITKTAKSLSAGGCCGCA